MTTVTTARPLSQRTPTPPIHGFWPVTFKNVIIAMTNPWNLVFTIGLPVMIYLIFGTIEMAEQPLEHGNVAAAVLVSMAQYATVMAISMLTAEIAIESSKGWTRTMALTPLGVRAYMFAKVLISVIVGIIVLILIFTIGHATGSQMDFPTWVTTFGLIVILSVVPALLGLVVAAMVGGEQAYGVLGGSVALLGFLSGMFVPLDQLNEFFQTFAKFTPLWGMNQIALGPLTGWTEFDHLAIVNVLAWVAIMAAGAAALSKRFTNR
ncbi:MAG: ABC transporter permease [Actinomycetaceae bacterium]|nr:ABC transporter permease [Actinomycetaceae bacterium]